MSVSAMVLSLCLRVTPSHLSYIIFSCFKNGSPAHRGRTSGWISFFGSYVCRVAVPLKAVGKEVKRRVEKEDA